MIVRCVVIMLALVAFPALAQEHVERYRAEIMEKIIDPCHMVAARLNPTPGIDTEQIVELAQLLQADGIETMVVDIADLLEKSHPTPEARSMVYVVAFRACLKGVMG